MVFRWDWLRPVLTAPVVPTLGPVHPHALSVDLFEATLLVASDRRFLPYDKDRRWGGEKQEVVLADDLVHHPDYTLIPTLLTRGRGAVKVFAYGHRSDVPDQAAELAAKLAAVHEAAAARIVRPLAPDTSHPRGVRIQFQDFTARHCPPSAGPVRRLEDWPAPVRSSFTTFAQTMAADGFAFLDRQLKSKECGPVLVAVLEDRVVGALGPMEIGSDPTGMAQLMPQYFAVHPDARGRGLGRHLWRAAMHWGQTRGAAYQILQTEVGGASEHLCRTEGLATLGFVEASTVCVLHGSVRDALP
ncbi:MULTISPECIES: GNAT family N-acetyltransferase [unclassified Streptomyces]|uniref:GNAT family N-acetyltransferase n=1 Tax=unclassified Streptomyces TaxID=2593676 RepID=UPI000BAC7AA2|nr:MULTISPECIES: GNAT family N-acetyltransferase [unclassified Streptomyces]ASY33536.1 GNAT family N-acetyltransferase [Streptomyces sp. CLI2509]MYX22738.1 GNAT family N-acetyltransferase [Streptomyces sp. SID8380]